MTARIIFALALLLGASRVLSHAQRNVEPSSTVKLERARHHAWWAAQIVAAFLLAHAAIRIAWFGYLELSLMGLFF